MIREKHESREEWLEARTKPMSGLGGSDAALICGVEGAFGNLDELYDVKKGLKKPKNITNSRIEGGISAEPLLRELFAIANRDRYKVTYRGYDILRSEKYPFMTATLDGEIEDFVDNLKGIWECKFVTITKRSEYEAWENGRIPEKYLVQQIHQLEVTEWGFCVLDACLVKQPWKVNEDGSIQRRHPYSDIEHKYCYISRSDPDYRANADYIIAKEKEFWDNLVAGKRPATRLF